jgi:hypothetical protein
MPDLMFAHDKLKSNVKKEEKADPELHPDKKRLLIKRIIVAKSVNRYESYEKKRKN